MNYSELVATSQAYADRQDTEVAMNMDTFILMTEARVNRLLKTREQSCRIFAPTVEGQEYYSLPPDYIGMRDIQLDDPLPTTTYTTQQFTYLNPEQFNAVRGQPYTGCLYYTVIANQIQIYPIQDAGLAIELVYFQRVPPLTAANPDNWMATNHPDIYLAGMCAEISLFAKDYDTATGWFERLKLAVSELDNTDVQERWAGSSLVTRAG